jgi:hypothetical protein
MRFLLAFSLAASLVAQHRSLETLTQEAPRIVTGKVLSTESFIGEDDEIYTRVRIDVASTLKGQRDSGWDFTVKGGQIGDRVVWFSDVPHFDNGQDVLVFGSETQPEEAIVLNTVEGRRQLELVRRYRKDTGNPVEEILQPDGVMDLDVTNPCSAYMGPKWSSPTTTYALAASIPAGWSGAIQAAAQAWTQGGSRFALTFSASSPHTISFADLGAGSTLASTRVEFFQSSQQLVRFSMTFNNRYTWSTSGQAGQFDVQNIATHEFGHAVGLGHPSAAECAQVTMWASAGSGETKKRSLEPGDTNGIITLYGTSGTTVPPPVLTPLVSYFAIVSTNPVAATPLTLVLRGSNIDPARIEGLVTGGSCGSSGCVARPYAATATDLVFINSYPAGSYNLRLRNGGTAPLGTTSSSFTVR